MNEQGMQKHWEDRTGGASYFPPRNPRSRTPARLHRHHSARGPEVLGESLQATRSQRPALRLGEAPTRGRASDKRQSELDTDL